MKDLAEKCMERIAVSPMMELSAFNLRVSKEEAMHCFHQKINNPFLCFIICGHAKVALRRSVAKTSTRNV